jgi:hypothetical protein
VLELAEVPGKRRSNIARSYDSYLHVFSGARHTTTHVSLDEKTIVVDSRKVVYHAEVKRH